MSPRQHSLASIFYPRSVAIMGLSPDHEDRASAILRNLQRCGFQEKVFGVGAGRGGVIGVSMYDSLEALPEPIDLAVLVGPAVLVPQYLEAAAKKGARGAILSSNGPIGYEEEPGLLEQELMDIAVSYKLRFFGPNCMGIVNTDNGLYTSFSSLNHSSFLKGRNSLVAQNGEIGLSCANLFSQERQGVGKVISMGNELNVDEVELLEYLDQDPATAAIFFYLEHFKRGRKLFDMARRASKPVVLVKANRFQESTGIAFPPTDMLTSDDQVITSAARQAGVLRVAKLEEMVLCAKAFALPSCEGNNLAILSPSGGFAAIAADAAMERGFRLPPLPKALLAKVESKERSGGMLVSNPVDLGDMFNPEGLLDGVKEVLNLPSFSALAVNFALPIGAAPGEQRSWPGWELVTRLRDLCYEFRKPLAVSVFEPQAESPGSELAGFPIFKSIDAGIQALALQRDYWKQRRNLSGG